MLLWVCRLLPKDTDEIFLVGCCRPLLSRAATVKKKKRLGVGEAPCSLIISIFVGGFSFIGPSRVKYQCTWDSSVFIYNN